MEVREEKRNDSLVKTTVKKFCESSTIHGISSISNASNAILRIFWTVIFLSVSSVLAWQISELIKNIYSTDIVIATKKVYRDELEFPSVIVSNAGPYSKARLMSITQVANSSKPIEDLKRVLSKLSYKEVKKMGNPLGYECLFGATKCRPLETPFPLIGTYLSFNHKLVWKQKNPGPENGLEVVLNINARDYSSTFKQGYGALIYIAGSRFVTYSLLHNKGIAVSPGTLTKINMKMKKTIRLPHPYPDNCKQATDVKELKGFHFWSTLTGMYSLEFCQFLTLLRNQMTYCGVVDPEYKFLIDQNVIKEKSNISYNISGNSSEVENIRNCLKREKNRKAKSDCRLPCIADEFDFTVSHLRWPSTEEALERLEALKKSKPLTSNVQNWTVDDIYKNLLKIQVYFSEFDIDVVEQKPAYGWIDFLSDLGGLLGLYIGASVYSVLEIWSLLFSLIYYACNSTRKAGKVSRINRSV